MPRLTGFAPASVRGPRALPFVGVHLNALRLLADPIGQMMDLHSRFGDVAAIVDGSPAVVCAFGAERNREVLSNQALFDNDDAFFVKTEPGSALERFRHGLVFQTGQAHKRHRRLMMPAFQKAAIDTYVPDIVAVTEEALRSWPKCQKADIASLTRELVQRIAVRCLFGVDWNENERGIGQIMTETLELVTAPATAVFPVRLPGTPYNTLFEKSEELSDRYFALIDEKRKKPLGNDALSLMIRARDDDNGALSDDELVGEASTLFIAGHDTQAKTLAWTLFLLERHPKIMAAVVDEIESVLRGGPPSIEHLPRMPLVERVLKESMRVLSPVPALFVRVCQEEATLGGVALPKQANVVLSPFITHRDPDRFPEPTRFLPERWEHIQPSIYEYIPFGAGPRMCIGAGFASLAMRLILPMIVQRFRLSLAYGATISRHVRGNILGPKYGIPMLIAPQDRRFTPRFRAGGDIPGLLDLRASGSPS